ncbi:tRNA (N(6)-L-threonylcarbamoyladenosine(37)-C(2))-methylthiotransferase, partial [archaeon]|nr:tRNA (N(6)-L-threonylcarbamoyladenosine(37)-C(2))-methylthiotransferase [archaeon]
ISGCLPETELERVRKIAPKSAIVGTNHISKIGVAADFALNNETVVFVGKNREEKVNVPKIRTNSVVDIVPISNGCLSFCSFCSTKIAKGDLTSFNVESIIKEIRNAKVGSGAKEFWLTSQDCGCYGFDKNTNIAELIKQITNDVSGTYFLRIGMANPQHLKRFLPQLLDIYSDDHVFKFLHIPVQSGNDNVLKRMSRGHTVDDYKSIASDFRGKFDATLWTDIIVGFPGETDSEFEDSIKLVKETEPDVVNISSYSARPGTKATRMKQVSTETKKDRTRIIADTVKEIYKKRNKKWLGWTGPVIVDEFNAEKSSFIGRNIDYKPVVLRENLEMGQILDVKITDFTSTYLIGEPVENA